MNEQLLTIAEMDKAINDPDHVHHLNSDGVRLVLNHLVMNAPAATAAAICEVQKLARS